MLHELKKRLYFVVAAYFAFWAKFVLKRWGPRIIVITGSSGKTTVLHMVEAQMGTQAVYSHQANSAIGIPFHILGMDSNVLSKSEWPKRFIQAPLKARRAVPSEAFYVVEADCDRPHEGDFTAKLLKPEATLWISVSNTHSMNFDALVKAGAYQSHEAAIAHEFGFFVAETIRLVMLNADQPVMLTEANRARKATIVKQFSDQAVTGYSLTTDNTSFTINNQTITLRGLHPKEAGVSLQMVQELLSFLHLPFDPSFRQLTLPPGRSAVFAGNMSTTLIDSTYNTGLAATEAILKLFAYYPSQHKWAVIGDILEQKNLEQTEHEKLATLLGRLDLQQIVLLGPRVLAHTYPILKARQLPVVAFENAGEALQFIQQNLKGGETILFKGARGMEGIVEQLLVNPVDAAQLVRRGPEWIKRRQGWGLPR